MHNYVFCTFLVVICFENYPQSPSAHDQPEGIKYQFVIGCEDLKTEGIAIKIKAVMGILMGAHWMLSPQASAVIPHQNCTTLQHAAPYQSGDLAAIVIGQSFEWMDVSLKLMMRISGSRGYRMYNDVCRPPIIVVNSPLGVGWDSGRVFWTVIVYCIEGHLFLTLMLLVNFANTKWCKKVEKWLNPWHMGSYLRARR